MIPEDVPFPCVLRIFPPPQALGFPRTGAARSAAHPAGAHLAADGWQDPPWGRWLLACRGRALRPLCRLASCRPSPSERRLPCARARPRSGGRLDSFALTTTEGPGRRRWPGRRSQRPTATRSQSAHIGSFLFSVSFPSACHGRRAQACPSPGPPPSSHPARCLRPVIHERRLQESEPDST